MELPIQNLNWEEFTTKQTHIKRAKLQITNVNSNQVLMYTRAPDGVNRLFLSDLQFKVPYILSSSFNYKIYGKKLMVLKYGDVQIPNTKDRILCDVLAFLPINDSNTKIAISIFLNSYNLGYSIQNNKKEFENIKLTEFSKLRQVTDTLSELDMVSLLSYSVDSIVRDFKTVQDVLHTFNEILFSIRDLNYIFKLIKLTYEFSKR